jgi:hypothetical protein
LPPTVACSLPPVGIDCGDADGDDDGDGVDSGGAGIVDVVDGGGGCSIVDGVDSGGAGIVDVVDVVDGGGDDGNSDNCIEPSSFPLSLPFFPDTLLPAPSPPPGSAFIPPGG